MSSVLIRGMEMPKNCKECMFADFDDVDFDYELYCTANGKYADLDMYDHPMGWDCPLVEIPTPHGRLIDATFEENHYASMLLNPTPDVTEQDKHKARIVIDALRMAKTVIEAEGSEE